jgi:hypothetical protein
MANARDNVAKLASFASVTEPRFGALGDGVTDDTTEIQTAVTAAYAGGYPLYWPDGTYLTTASIANFHSVRHIGPGVVKRGSDLFKVDPREGDTNALFVSPSGTVGADGLSASFAAASFQEAFTALKNYGPMLDGSWQITSAAGTYTGAAATNQIHTVPSRNFVTIQGPTATHPAVPTCIFDGAGGVAYEHGMRISGVGVRATIKAIKFIDYTTSNSRIGLVGENEADLWTQNIHADNCDWCGIYGFGTLHFRLAGGILNACRSGVVFNAVGEGTIGYGASSTADGPVITNSTQSGVYWSRGSQGHVDYCKIEDNPVGLDIDQASRTHAVSNNFKRNNIAIRQQASSMLVDSTSEFNRGGADANGINYQRNSYTLEFDEGRATFSEMLVETWRVVTTHTGTAALTKVIQLSDIPAYRLENVSSRVRIEVYGRMSSVSAATAIGVGFSGTKNMVTVVGTPAANASYEFHSAVREAQGGGFRQFSRVDVSASSPRIGDSALAIDATTVLTPEIWIQLGNSADSIIVDRVEVFILG